jgi:hypothetical protein
MASTPPAPALAVSGHSYKHVESILHNGLDRAALPKTADEADPINQERPRAGLRESPAPP